MEHERIIDKINKLLRMKRGGTPAEIETALAMAREIAAKHGIDIKGIDPEEKLKSELGHEDGYAARRVPYDVRFAAKIVEMFFSVDVIYRPAAIKVKRRLWGRLTGDYFVRGYSVAFVGRKFEIEIAIYVFRFIYGHFARSWNRRQNRRLKSRQSFVYGMFTGIVHKLRAEQAPLTPDQSQALVLSRQYYIAKNFGPITESAGKTPGVADAAAMAGYAEGQKTNIRKGVERGETEQLRIT